MEVVVDRRYAAGWRTLDKGRPHHLVAQSSRDEFLCQRVEDIGLLHLHIGQLVLDGGEGTPMEAVIVIAHGDEFLP